MNGAAEDPRKRPGLSKMLYLANSADGMTPGTMWRFADILSKNVPPGLRWHYERMPDERHATIYHPAALRAFRMVFKPAAGGGK